jgi:hypothetical protein
LFHRKALKNESEVANLFTIPETTVSEELKSEEAAHVADKFVDCFSQTSFLNGR